MVRDWPAGFRRDIAHSFATMTNIAGRHALAPVVLGIAPHFP
jgi:hypothetical protein